MAAYFKLEKHDAVALLTYDRPEKRNPINEDSISELEVPLIHIRDDDSVRALLITGREARSWTAGRERVLTPHTPHTPHNPRFPSLHHPHSHQSISGLPM